MGITISIESENKDINSQCHYRNYFDKSEALIVSNSILLNAFEELCTVDLSFISNNKLFYCEGNDPQEDYYQDIDYIIKTAQHFINCLNKYPSTKELSTDIATYSEIPIWSEIYDEGYYKELFKRIVEIAKFYKEKGAKKILFVYG